MEDEWTSDVRRAAEELDERAHQFQVAVEKVITFAREAGLHRISTELLHDSIAAIQFSLGEESDGCSLELELCLEPDAEAQVHARVYRRAQSSFHHWDFPTVEGALAHLGKLMCGEPEDAAKQP